MAGESLGSTGNIDMNEHSPPRLLQLTQDGCVSSHFMCRCLHCLHPNLDFFLD